MWKNWRPLLAEYIGIFSKNPEEGTTAFLVHCFVDFACDGNYGAQILFEPIHNPAAINPYTVRPLMGLHGNSRDEVPLYNAGEWAKIAMLHIKAKLSKRDCLWEILYLHKETTLIHLS